MGRKGGINKQKQRRQKVANNKMVDLIPIMSITKY